MARQVAAMREYGIDDRNIIQDAASGKDFDRHGYLTLVGTESAPGLLREGDLLVIYSLDRLGRNYDEVITEWKRIVNELGCDIHVLDMPLLDTTARNNSLDGKLVSDIVLQLLGYVAQKERENTLARQKAGIAQMRIGEDGKRYSAKTGRAIGRPLAQFPSQWESVYKEWKDGRITAVSAMDKLCVKRNTFYRLVKRYEDANTEGNGKNDCG